MLNEKDLQAINKFLLFAEIKNSGQTEGINTTEADLKLAEEKTKNNLILKGEKQNLFNLKNAYSKGKNIVKEYQKLKYSDVLEIAKRSENFYTQTLKTKDNKIQNLNVPLVSASDVKIYLEDFVHNFNKNNLNLNIYDFCSLTHWYFEIIHPFADGNGRIGRVLIYVFFLLYELWPSNLVMPISYAIFKKTTANEHLGNQYKRELNMFRYPGLEHKNIQEQLAKFTSQKNRNDFSGLANFYQTFSGEKTIWISYFEFMQFAYLNSFEKTIKFIKKYSQEKKRITIKLKQKQFSDLTNENILHNFVDLLFSEYIVRLDKLRQILNPHSPNIKKINQRVKKIMIYLDDAFYKGTFNEKRQKNQSTIYFGNKRLYKVFSINEILMNI